MCLSDAFAVSGGERSPLMNYVSGISVDGEKVVLTDMLGANRSGVLAVMVEPLGGPVGVWNHFLHLLQRPFKWIAKRRMTKHESI